MRSLRPALLLAAGLALAAFLVGCSKDNGSSGTSYDVKAGDDTCDVERTTIPAGKVTFHVENDGGDVTEVYVYGKKGEDFTQIVNEVENIGPGTARDMDVTLKAGHYQVACKPGMVGDGIRTDLTVTSGSGATGTSEQG